LLKWHVGLLRPEEAAFQIERGLLNVTEHGVPPRLARLIQSFNLKSPQEFTAYEEGSPPHPSWPAMHSAASGASLWLATIADLTPEQYCQVLLTDYAVSYARLVAGVHYKGDNIAGLNLGQKLLAEALPGHLAERYGANEAAARRKIATLRFDWNTFDPFTCTYQQGV
jgi:membrane-associated phospholipid phosphatase